MQARPSATCARPCSVLTEVLGAAAATASCCRFHEPFKRTISTQATPPAPAAQPGAGQQAGSQQEGAAPQAAGEAQQAAFAVEMDLFGDDEDGEEEGQEEGGGSGGGGVVL